MENELQRLSSFAYVPEIVQPCRLARIGFYYKGPKDYVACYRCQYVVDGWPSIYEILYRHRVFSPKCPVGGPLQNTGVDLRMLSYTDCLETYDDWPSYARSIVRPEDLSQAGLFYTGYDDKVQCVFCGGYLSGWVTGDRPSDKHRKKFPRCQVQHTVF